MLCLVRTFSQELRAPRFGRRHHSTLTPTPAPTLTPKEFNMQITRRAFLKTAAASGFAIGGAIALGAARGAFAQASPRVLKLSHGNPESDTVHQAAVRMAELVKQRTGGGLEIRVYANGQLGSDAA